LFENLFLNLYLDLLEFEIKEQEEHCIFAFFVAFLKYWKLDIFLFTLNYSINEATIYG
jgi:hypothetical protein